MSTAHNFGEVVSPIGRVRRLPDIGSANDYKASHAGRQAINSPVQALASDLMQMAAGSIGGYLPGYSRVLGTWPIATVHDSVVVEVSVDLWEDAVNESMARMMNLNPVLKQMGCDLTVPLGVEASVGERWGRPFTTLKA